MRLNTLSCPYWAFGFSFMMPCSRAHVSIELSRGFLYAFLGVLHILDNNILDISLLLVIHVVNISALTLWLLFLLSLFCLDKQIFNIF